MSLNINILYIHNYYNILHYFYDYLQYSILYSLYYTLEYDDIVILRIIILLYSLVFDKKKCLINLLCNASIFSNEQVFFKYKFERFKYNQVSTHTSSHIIIIKKNYVI